MMGWRKSLPAKCLLFVGMKREKCWQILMKRIPSQHANVLGILTNAVPASNQQRLLADIMKDHSITQCTYYFKFYLFEALKKVQLGDQYLPMLQPWDQMIRIGLTTFAEQPEPTRSDCHAWSASPNYEMLSLVCGVKSASPGFETVLIEPWLGDLKIVEGRIPHPKGDIRVKYEKTGSSLKAEVNLPTGLTGRIKWKGKTIELKSGLQSLTLP